MGALATALTTQVVLDALALSLITTSISLVITICLGLPLAVVLARRRFRGRACSRPSSTSRSCCRPRSPASACSWCSAAAVCWAGRSPLFGISIPFTTFAVVLAQVFVSAPFFIRSARTGIASVPRELEDAARVDGAGERHLFLRITVPLAARPSPPAWS